MSRVVTAQQFVTAFASVVFERRWEVELYEQWRNGLKWGRLFCADAEGALAEVAKRLGLEYKREYLKVDAFMYKRAQIAEGFGVDIPSVVLEDEGKRDASYWEMNKLSILNAPLKVLVTYPNERWNDRRLLAMYEDILDLADLFSDFTVNRKQLVILGYCSAEAHRLFWRFFLYGDAGFEQLSPRFVAIFKAVDSSRDPVIAHEVGRIWFDGQLRHNGFPANAALKDIMESNVQLGERVYTASDGDEFVRVLPVGFQGTYFWAELEPVEAMDQLRAEMADHRPGATNGAES